MEGTRFCIVGMGSYRPAREKGVVKIRVGVVSMNSFLA